MKAHENASAEIRNKKNKRFFKNCAPESKAESLLVMKAHENASAEIRNKKTKNFLKTVPLKVKLSRY